MTNSSRRQNLQQTADSTADSVDEQFMQTALQLAQQGEGLAEPNPMVGCVIVRDGQVIGTGYHKKFGGPHAEVEALRSLPSKADAKGATAYVTLEPCCHHGKTPPCSQALIEAGLSRVVVATRDPAPHVDGGGIKQLTDAEIDVTTGVLEAASKQVCAPYLKKVKTGLPWVIAKWAMTIDGKIATKTGESKWITATAARAKVHRLRSRVDAVVAGMGTVVADDPMLTARLDDQDLPRVAKRVIYCRKRVPSLRSKLVQSAKQTPLVLVVGSKIRPDALDQLIDHGAEIVKVDTDDPIEIVRQSLAVLGQQGMTNIMLEAGGELIGSFFSADQIDECQVFVGPKAFGGQAARGPIGGQGIDRIEDAWPGKLLSIEQLDHDFVAVYRRT